MSVFRWYFVGVGVRTLAWHIPVRPGVGPESHRHSARRETHRSATERPHGHREVAELYVEGVGREIPGDRRDAASSQRLKERVLTQ